MCKETCPECNGEGKLDCTDCVDCSFCEATGTIPPGEAYQSKVCTECDGTMKVCDKCDDGTVTCEDCEGTGKVDS